MKKKPAILQWAALLAVFLVVIVFVLFDSSQKIMRKAEVTVRNSVKEVVEKYEERIYAKLQSIRTGGESAALLMEIYGLDNLQESLQAICKTTDVSRAVYLEEAATAVDQDGKSVDLREKPYAKEAVQELEDTVIICVEDSEVAEGRLFLLLVPVPGRSGRLLLYYPIEKLKGIMDMTSAADRSTVSALVDAEGSIIATTGTASSFFAGENFWENMDPKCKAEVSKAQMKMRSLGSGRAELSTGEEDGILFYVPIGVEKLFFVADYDQDYIDRQEKQLWNESKKMLYQITGIMVLFFLIIMVVSLIGKIRNEGNNRALEEKADTDLLTGLSNKIATERKIKEYISDHPDSLALMFVLDIDNFKKINDTMGHAFGDEVLRTLGKHIGANFRVTDIIGRTGGDEFTIFLKSLKDDSNTLREAQKLVDFFRKFEAGEYVKYSATASIGAAVYPADGSDFETLYKAADQALYKAKERGKDQLAFYDDRDRK